MGGFGENGGGLDPADQAKLDGIEAGAEVNPTDAETKTAYENNANTNAFTDSDQSQIANIEVNSDNIALLALRSQIDAGWAYLNMVNGISDEYQDETGIDGSNTVAAYDAGTNSYSSAETATLLIQSDTTNGSTTFTDEVNAATINVVGDAQHSTAQSQFGASSIRFDGTTDELNLADDDNWNFGSGDFTVDFWLRVDNVSGFKVLAGQTDNSNSRAWLMYMSGSSIILQHSTNGSSYQANITASSVISATTWHHVMLVQDNGTFRIFVDGTQETSGTAAGAIFNSTAPLRFGSSPSSTTLTGYMDEIRVLKGRAVETSNFTPPTASYVLAPDNITLQTISFTAESEPTVGRVVLLHEDIGGVTLNTDVTAEISKDGGSTFTSVTLVDQGPFDSTRNILSCSDTTLSGTGTSVVLKIQTANEVEQTFHGHYLQWG